MIFAYHGYPWLIHRLTYRRANHPNIHVRGYKEEGTTTTPFDMVMLNDLDRFHLVMDVIDRVPGLAERAAHLRQHMIDERLRHRAYTREHGDDPPELRNWTWPAGEAPRLGRAGCRATRACTRRLGRRCASWSSTRARAASSCGCWTDEDAILAEEELPAPAAQLDAAALRTSARLAPGRGGRGRSSHRARR